MAELATTLITFIGNKGKALKAFYSVENNTQIIDSGATAYMYNI